MKRILAFLLALMTALSFSAGLTERTHEDLPIAVISRSQRPPSLSRPIIFWPVFILRALTR